MRGGGNEAKPPSFNWGGGGHQAGTLRKQSAKSQVNPITMSIEQEHMKYDQNLSFSEATLRPNKLFQNPNTYLHFVYAFLSDPGVPGVRSMGPVVSI